MNCERFQSVVADLAREVIMDVSDRAAVRAHLDNCADCAGRLQTERDLTAALRGLVGQMKDLAAPDQLEEKMLTAFREHRNGKHRNSNYGNFSRVVPLINPLRHRHYWAAAIAAALLIAFAFFMIRGRLIKEPEMVAGTRPNANEVVVETPKVKEPEFRPAQPESGNAPMPHRRQSMRNVANSSQPSREKQIVEDSVTKTVALANSQTDRAEVATEFFPIGYTTTPNLQEGGQLLRVELPRAAVARFGLPVNMDRAGERVKADVLIGADGLAQAIRFVQ